MDRNPMAGKVFKPIAYLLNKLDSSENRHDASIWEHSRDHQLFPFYPADIATPSGLSSTHHLSTNWHTSKCGIDKTVSADLVNAVHALPLLRHKCQIFAQRFQCQPFRNKYASSRMNLATLLNMDTNLSFLQSPQKKRAVAEKYAVFQILRNKRSGQNFYILNVLEIVFYMYILQWESPKPRLQTTIGHLEFFKQDITKTYKNFNGYLL